MITLCEFVTHYFASRSVSPLYQARVERRAAKLEAFAGAHAIRRVLTEETVNRFLKSLTLSPFTVRCYRSDIMSLWCGAADRNLVPEPRPRRIVATRTPELVVECYSDDEARLLVEAAKLLKGAYRNGVARRLYWEAVLRLAWDSGLRRGDVWAFDRAAVRPDGQFAVVQRKTAQLHRGRLRASTIAALDATGKRRPCEWMLDPSMFRKHFRRIVQTAGVNRGSFKWLRRSSGSYVEADLAGAGHKHLGQRTATVFDRNYDAKLGGHTLPMPPEL